MEKINFVNGSQPAINDTNLNQLQTNVENSINALQSNVNDMISTLGIEEEKTVNGIHYIKYKNGKLIQYGNLSYNVVAVDRYYNIGYRTAEWYFGGVAYPIKFTQLDSLQITDVVDNAYSTLLTRIQKYENKLTYLPKWTWISADKIENGITVIANFFAIGKWK